MAWWFCRSYSYAGPGFDWIEDREESDRRGLVSSGLSVSRPLSARHVPKVARYRERYAKPPSPDLFFVDSAVAVTARFRELVEQFEPDLHLFVPIELQFHDGMLMPGEFYFFNANVDVDCILTDNQSEWFKDYAGDGRIQPTINSIQKLTPREINLSRPQIEGRHLWTGGPLGYGQLFVSDEFCTAFRKSRFREIEIRRECHEIDRSWIAEEQMGPLLDTWRNYVAHHRNIEVGYF
jgi:hypothetical protein